MRSTRSSGNADLQSLPNKYRYRPSTRQPRKSLVDKSINGGQEDGQQGQQQGQQGFEATAADQGEEDQSRSDVSAPRSGGGEEVQVEVRIPLGRNSPLSAPKRGSAAPVSAQETRRISAGGSIIGATVGEASFGQLIRRENPLLKKSATTRKASRDGGDTTADGENQEAIVLVTSTLTRSTEWEVPLSPTSAAKTTDTTNLPEPSNDSETLKSTNTRKTPPAKAKKVPKKKKTGKNPPRKAVGGFPETSAPGPVEEGTESEMNKLIRNAVDGGELVEQEGVQTRSPSPAAQALDEITSNGADNDSGEGGREGSEEDGTLGLIENHHRISLGSELGGNEGEDKWQGEGEKEGEKGNEGEEEKKINGEEDKVHGEKVQKKRKRKEEDGEYQEKEEEYEGSDEDSEDEDSEDIVIRCLARVKKSKRRLVTTSNRLEKLSEDFIELKTLQNHKVDGWFELINEIASEVKEPPAPDEELTLERLDRILKDLASFHQHTTDFAAFFRRLTSNNLTRRANIEKSERVIRQVFKVHGYESKVKLKEIQPERAELDLRVEKARIAMEIRNEEIRRAIRKREREVFGCRTPDSSDGFTHSQKRQRIADQYGDNQFQRQKQIRAAEAEGQEESALSPTPQPYEYRVEEDDRWSVGEEGEKSERSEGEEEEEEEEDHVVVIGDDDDVEVVEIEAFGERHVKARAKEMAAQRAIREPDNGVEVLEDREWEDEETKALLEGIERFEGNFRFDKIKNSFGYGNRAPLRYRSVDAIRERAIEIKRELEDNGQGHILSHFWDSI